MPACKLYMNLVNTLVCCAHVFIVIKSKQQSDVLIFRKSPTFHNSETYSDVAFPQSQVLSLGQA